MGRGQSTWEGLFHLLSIFREAYYGYEHLSLQLSVPPSCVGHISNNESHTKLGHTVIFL